VAGATGDLSQQFCYPDHRSQPKQAPQSMPARHIWRDLPGTGTCCVAPPGGPCDLAAGRQARPRTASARQTRNTRRALGPRVHAQPGLVCGVACAAGSDCGDSPVAGELVCDGGVPPWPRSGEDGGGGMGHAPVGSPLSSIFDVARGSFEWRLCGVATAKLQTSRSISGASRDGLWSRRR
jgi:hypothetical protein